MNSTGYELVRLPNGVFSVRSVAEQETFHPVIGPAAEAQALYVRQLDLIERLRTHTGEFVIWDVGLGAAANATAVLSAAKEVESKLRLISFDHTVAPLAFALEHADALGYLEDYAAPLRDLAAHRNTRWTRGQQEVSWTLELGDFPSFVQRELERSAEPSGPSFPKPHIILYDPFSLAKNPAMWTQPLFAQLFRLLDGRRPCAMPTYSRSTLLRVSLLLAGFFVGAGHATGEKEETTIAANCRELIREPLDRRWLTRARHSTSAEPLWEARYLQAPLRRSTLEKLEQHPQFQD